MIDTIMVFAAGFGSRMGEISKEKPKPLVPVLGVPLIYYALNSILKYYPFKRIVINTHYHYQQVEKSINDFKSLYHPSAEIILIHESEILETGGGVKNAINLLGNNPIFTCNSDVIIQTSEDIFTTLYSNWDSSLMNFLLLLQPYEKAFGYKNNGDFELLADGKIHKPINQKNYSYIYAGISIIKPEIIKNNPLQIFSLRDYYLKDSQVYGFVVPNCQWYHATTPEDIIEIEHRLKLSS